MIISHNLKWNMHISELSRKGSSRLYFLRQLKRSGVAPSELVLFYMTCIRPVLEYASPVFHRFLPNYISEDLEQIQRRAIRIIYPDLSYSVALESAGLPKLHERREKISTDLFDEIVCDPTHRLHSLLPQSRAKNWRSHGRQWRVKTDQGHQELTVKRPMCDYATEFRKVAI